MLRAAARFYISEDAPEIALRLLVNTPMTRHDPWLMAAEVATAQLAGRGSKFFKHGKSMLDNPSFRLVNLSELAAAVGTVELEDGRRKDAKRRFEMAMLDPTENALAQVKWAEDKSNSLFAFGKPPRIRPVPMRLRSSRLTTRATISSKPHGMSISGLTTSRSLLPPP